MVRENNNTSSYISNCLEEMQCDSCGKIITLLDYYNQDGICVQCFKKWCGYDI